MRKISKTRSLSLDRNATDTDLHETRPLRIAGGTITSWPGSVDIDLDSFFARPLSGPTVAGALATKVKTTEDSPTDRSVADLRSGDRPKAGTVSLSDGTRITFATANQFDTVELS
jgi:hypothetical protein